MLTVTEVFIYFKPVLDSPVLSLARKSLKVFKRFIDIKELYNMELPYRLGTVRQVISYTSGGIGIVGVYKKQEAVEKSLNKVSPNIIKWRLHFAVHLTNLLKALAHSLRYLSKNIFRMMAPLPYLTLVANLVQIGGGGSKSILMAEKLVAGGKRPALYYAARFTLSVFGAMFSLLSVLFFFQFSLVASSTYLIGTTGILIGSFILDLYKYLRS